MYKPQQGSVRIVNKYQRLSTFMRIDFINRLFLGSVYAVKSYFFVN